MTEYVAIESRLYKLTKKNIKEFHKTFPWWSQAWNFEYDEEEQEAVSCALDWIEKHGKYLGPCNCYAY